MVKILSHTTALSFCYMRNVWILSLRRIVCLAPWHCIQKANIHFGACMYHVPEQLFYVQNRFINFYISKKAFVLFVCELRFFLCPSFCLYLPLVSLNFYFAQFFPFLHSMIVAISYFPHKPTRYNLFSLNNDSKRYMYTKLQVAFEVSMFSMHRAFYTVEKLHVCRNLCDPEAIWRTQKQHSGIMFQN